MTLQRVLSVALLVVSLILPAAAARAFTTIELEVLGNYGPVNPLVLDVSSQAGGVLTYELEVVRATDLPLPPVYVSYLTEFDTSDIVGATFAIYGLGARFTEPTVQVNASTGPVFIAVDQLQTMEQGFQAATLEHLFPSGQGVNELPVGQPVVPLADLNPRSRFDPDDPLTQLVYEALVAGAGGVYQHEIFSTTRSPEVQALVDGFTSVATVTVISETESRKKYGEGDRPARYALFQSIADQIESILVMHDFFDAGGHPAWPALDELEAQGLDASDPAASTVYSAYSSRNGQNWVACLDQGLTKAECLQELRSTLTQSDLSRIFSRSNPTVSEGFGYLWQDDLGTGPATDLIIDLADYGFSFGGQSVTGANLLPFLTRSMADGRWNLSVLSSPYQGMVFDRMTLSISLASSLSPGTVTEPTALVLVLAGVAMTMAVGTGRRASTSQ